MSNVLYTVSSPPSWHCGRTVNSMMMDTLLALVPAILFSAYHYGFDALRVTALCGATAVAAELAVQRMQEQEITVDDWSALLTGVLFAFMLPASAPWWLAIIGTLVAMLLGRHAFGGLGGNPLNAALVGWAVCMVSWKNEMSAQLTILNTNMATPMQDLKFFGPENADLSFFGMLFGDQMGGLGATQVLPLLLGGIWLVRKGVIRPQIPLSFLGGVFGMATLFWLAGMTAAPCYHVIGGSVIFAAFFLAPDHSSSPISRKAMIWYGILGGVLVMLIRVWGLYPDGVGYAILLANLCAPLLDGIRPKAFGKAAAKVGRA